MPDFSEQAAHQFWNDYPDPTIYKVIGFMESVEDWTADGNPEVETALLELGKVLDGVGRYDLKEPEAFIHLVAHVRTGRGLCILMALDQAYPGAASNVLMHAENTTQSSDDLAGMFLKRNIAFERLRLLSRIFGQDRVKLITQALEDIGS